MGSTPFTIKVPASHRITITAETNALYHQRVELTDMLQAEEYVLIGQGEDGHPMTIENNEPGSRRVQAEATKFPLPTIAHPSEPFRELRVACSFSKSAGIEDEWSYSKVWMSGPKDTDKVDVDNDHEWKIITEDGADDDRNDTVLLIKACKD